MTSARPIAVALFALLALALSAPAEAQLAEWDQERVTKIAVEIQEKTSALYDTFYKEPVPTLGSAQTRSYHGLKQDVRRIKNEGRHLAQALKEGQGREATLDVYENLMIKVRDAQEEARRTFTSETLLAAAFAAGDAIRRIAPYYDPEAARNPVKEAEEGAGQGN